MRQFLPKIRIPRPDHEDLVALAHECLRGCRVTADDGTVLFCPDGQGHYAALWTRDFCYMVEGAGKLIDPAEMRSAIDYLFAGQREDGVLPDRRQPDGLSVYNAGPVDRPLGDDAPADNAPFAAKLVCAYVRLTGDHRSLARWLPALFRAMDTVPLSPDGLVFIDPNRPRPGYGFTDCIAKTGKDLFASLLYWEACEVSARLCKDFEFHEDARDWWERCEPMYEIFRELWDIEAGMYRSASHDCRQIDIWGSAYAGRIRVASKTQTVRIGEFLLEHFDECVLSGHVRHLLAGQYWRRTYIEVPRDTYQNGGYWSVPTGWVAQVITRVDPERGRQVIMDALNEFRDHGVHEWISPAERHLPGYVASVTNLLGLCLPEKG